ncbi:hypothetical protein TNIN_467861 [Trichonephila inaurata madagascariensis]|uniref:Uncharacterized protein n=1 Tax=Trichonephila inaurata madagascariensis TaxID=2747483 RepID=A0A8X6XSA3_9ARAC|nr:hypothetical protein TNIN_467861 [Trichonephila inaurata madagascariensis]
MEGLWAHLRDDHSEPSTRKTMAMEAFPIFFRLDRLQDVLPIQDEGANPATPMRPANCSQHGSPRVPCQPSPTQLCDVARLPEATEIDSAPMCAVGLEAGGSDLSVPCMSCCLNSSLTVDQLVSPQQGDANQQLDRSVIIQIEDEEDDIAPPCTMELDTAMHECNLQDSEAQIPSTPSATNCEGPPQTDASPQPTPDEINACGPPREQDSPSILDIILGGESSTQMEAEDSVPPVQSDLIELTETWKDKLTGSPPKPAFSPPSYAKVARRGAAKVASVAKLWSCSNCPKKFYTEKGATDHKVTC